VGVDSAPKRHDDGFGRKARLVTGSSFVDAEDQIGNARLPVEYELALDVVRRQKATISSNHRREAS
jgi:hypothetical protein